jgi:hypothetical protein
MRNALLFLTMLSAGAYVSAQQTSSTKPSVSQGCPIGFGAQVNARAMARTVEDEKKNGVGPLLELTFGRRGAARILAATVAVHGLSASGRYLPVGESSDSQTTQSFQLGSEHRAARLTDADVRVNKVLSVDWVEVTKLEYADGSQWQASPDEQCRAVPSKLQLIDAVGERVQR